MDNQKALRQHVLYLLKGEGAHAGFEASVKDLPFKLQGKRPAGIPHSAWELLEHMRLAQRDILDYTRDARHVSPEFPEGYWPATPEPPDDSSWDKSVAAFSADLHAMAELISVPSNDLLAHLPHSDGKTILREALLLADHNTYHLGQLVLLRRLLGSWV